MSLPTTLFTSGQVAELLGVTSRRVRQLREEGKLAAFTRAGDDWLYAPDEVAAYRRLHSTGKADGAILDDLGNRPISEPPDVV